MESAQIMNILVMIIVGGVAGTLAARIARGTNFGALINILLGIAGAIVGGFLFNLLGLTPGSGIVNIIHDTFGVQLPENIVGMIVSATIGALIIIWVFGFLKGRRGRIS